MGPPGLQGDQSLLPAKAVVPRVLDIPGGVASRKCSLVTRLEIDWTKGGFTKVRCGWSRGE